MKKREGEEGGREREEDGPKVLKSEFGGGNKSDMCVCVFVCVQRKGFSLEGEN